MFNYKIYNKPPLVSKVTQQNNNIKPSTNFNQILQEHIESNKELKFSKHATQRLQQRDIQLNQQEIAKLNQAINTAAKKGIKETLIIMDNRAFIASVKNKTIITATTGEELEENVFTNIDGAVIL